MARHVRTAGSMSLARPVVPGQTVLITRRCSDRRFFLLPAALINQVLLYCLAVAAEGVRRWVERRASAEQYQRYQRSAIERADFVKLVNNYRTRLAAVYESTVSDHVKRSKKAALIEGLRTDYKSLQEAWGGSESYSAWISAPINNAKLNSVALYNDLVPGLNDLLQSEDNDLVNFYQRCRELGELLSDYLSVDLVDYSEGKKRVVSGGEEEHAPWAELPRGSLGNRH